MGDWRDDAACAGADTALFFPASSDDMTATLEAVAAYCDRCPVRAECAAQADDHGVWGGEMRGQKVAEQRSRECRGCGATFWRSSTSPVVYCPECRSREAVRRRERDARRELRARESGLTGPPYYIECVVCGTPAEVSKRNQRTCSEPCRDEHRRIRQIRTRARNRDALDDARRSSA